MTKRERRLSREKVRLQRLLMVIHSSTNEQPVKDRIEAEFFGRTSDRWKTSRALKRSWRSNAPTETGANA